MIEVLTTFVQQLIQSSFFASTIASLLHQMQVPAWYIGPELQVLSRNIKQEEIPVFVTRVLAEIPDYVQKVAVFQKDKIDGDLSQKVLDGFSGRGA